MLILRNRIMIFFVFVALAGMVLLLLGFMLYKSIVGPYLQRRHFRQYSNVWVNPSPKLVLHDVAAINERNEKKNGKYALLHYAGDIGIENPDKDFALIQLGTLTFLHVVSVQAFQETLQKIPGSIDRDGTFLVTTFGRYAPRTGFAQISNAKWKHTRETNGRAIQFNKSS